MIVNCVQQWTKQELAKNRIDGAYEDTFPNLTKKSDSCNCIIAWTLKINGSKYTSN